MRLALVLLLVAPLINACAQAPDEQAGNERELIAPPGTPFDAAASFPNNDNFRPPPQRDAGARPDVASMPDVASVPSRPWVPGGACDPDDNRWCRASVPEASVPCADRWEEVPSQLSCWRVPEGQPGKWSLSEGPRCKTAKLSWGEPFGNGVGYHEESCFYDAQTGKLIASRGKDSCAIFCGGILSGAGEALPEVRWGVNPDQYECWDLQPIVQTACNTDGTEQPIPNQPPNVNDGGPADGHAPPPRP